MQHFKKKNENIDDNLMIVGKNAVIEAIRTGKEIDKVFIQANLRGEFEKEIRQLTKTNNLPLVKVPLEKLNMLAGNGKHQGILAFISPVKYQSLADVIPHLFAEGRMPAILVLESVSDVRNFAAIARSAHVMGMDALVVTSKNSARINEETVRISAGAILNIPVCREKNMFEVIDLLHAHGIKIYATDLRGATPIDKSDFNMPMAVIMGDEHHGVTPESLKASDERIKIPQASGFDSLNVSVASGIIMYEIYRQRTSI